ncbi:tape measure protein [Rhizobium arsenicireducens]
MATEVERLIVSLEARTKAFENALNKANGVANRQANSIEKRFKTMNKGLSSSFVGLGRGIAAAIGGSYILREVGRLSEAATRIDNALKVAGLSGKELEDVYSALSDAAKRNGAPIESLVQLYGRVATVQKELGVSTEELLGFTNNVALALRVAGTDAQQASGALLQLSQALGGGVVRAEEFNSLLEGALPIVQAAAAGLEEAGGSVAKLRTLVTDGKISSEAFFRAFEAGSVILEKRAANATLTVSQATNNLYTSLIDAVREFNNATGAGENFARAIDGVASSLADVDVAGFIEKIQSAKAEFESFLQSLGNAQVFKDLNAAMGMTDEEGTLLNPDVSAAQEKIATLERELEVLKPIVEEDTALGLDTSDALTRVAEVRSEIAALRAELAGLSPTISGYKVVPGSGLVAVPDTGGGTNGLMGGPSTRGGARRPVAVETVSIDDFDSPSGKKKGGKSGGKPKQSEYAREIEQIRERTAAIQAETAAMAGLNPLIDDFGYSLEFARAKQELLTAAQKSGVAITPDVEASIDAMAAGYAEANAAADKLAETQDKLRKRAEFFADTAYDAFSELIPQIETGNEALDKFVNTLIEAVAQAALLGKGPLAGIGGGGGILGGIIGAIFPFAKGGIAANGRPLKQFAGGGISRTAAIFGEAGPEAAVPLPDGRRIPVDLRIPERAGRDASEFHVTFGVSADNNGNLKPFVEDVARRESGAAVRSGIGSYDKGLPGRFSEIMERNG